MSKQEVRVGQVWRRRGTDIRITGMGSNANYLYESLDGKATGSVPVQLWAAGKATLVQDAPEVFDWLADGRWKPQVGPGGAVDIETQTPEATAPEAAACQGCARGAKWAEDHTCRRAPEAACDCGAYKPDQGFLPHHYSFCATQAPEAAGWPEAAVRVVTDESVPVGFVRMPDGELYAVPWLTAQRDAARAEACAHEADGIQERTRNFQTGEFALGPFRQDPCSAQCGTLPKSEQFPVGSLGTCERPLSLTADRAKADLRRKVSSLREWPCCPTTQEPYRIEASVREIHKAIGDYTTKSHGRETVRYWQAKFRCVSCGK